MTDLQEILSAPEGKTVEFKRDLSSLKPILRTLVAFANTAGGTLVIGREDDGTVVGVPDVLEDEERLANVIADGIRPAMMPEIDLCSSGGSSLLVVRVPHCRGPFYLRAEGPEAGVYVRLGSTDRRAGPEILAELRRSLSGLSFDQMPCPDLSAEDLDQERLRRFFAQIRRKVSRKHIESLGVLVPHAGRLVPSHGGLVLFGQDSARESLLPDARVSCARFRGTDKTEFLDRLDTGATMLEALDDVPRFIRRNTRMGARITTMRRQDLPEYPEVAVREVLVNAVAHADYSLTGMQIRIAIYADRMEIENPGMLPFGMTLDDLKAGVSRIRNRVIVRVLRELGLVEQWGSGYQRVTETCQSGGYPTPQWQELGAALRVSFQPHPEVRLPGDVPVSVPVNVPVNERQQWLIDQLANGERPKARDVAEHFGVAEKTVRRDIADLKERSIIEFAGAPKTGFYRLRGPV